MDNNNHYKTLGIDSKADKNEIKKAYRLLARKYHPDVSKEADAEERFKQVNKAYDILGDDGKKHAYDQERAAPNHRPRNDPSAHTAQNHQPGSFDASFFEDIIRKDNRQTNNPRNDFFDNIFHSPNQRHTRNSEPTVATVPLSLEDIYHGSTRKIRLPDGRNLQVRIPKGIAEGQKIRISNGPGRGEMHLKVKIAPHSLFTADGKDIHLELPIAPWEAALGSMITIPTLDGKIKLRIPEGTQTGKKMRLSGKGLPGSPSGDQLIELIVVTPPATKKEHRELYRQMETEFAWDPRKDII